MFKRSSPSLAALERQAAESRADVEAATEVVRALNAARTPDEAVATALQVVRTRFGWAYGSYWALDPATRVLRFGQESGEAGAEFRKVTLEASFAEGVGLSGRAWRQRDLVFVPDLSQLGDCVRAPAAGRAGVRSGICFPIVEHGAVIGTMDFFTTEHLSPSEGRLAVLRSVGALVSGTIYHLY